MAKFYTYSELKPGDIFVDHRFKSDSNRFSIDVYGIKLSEYRYYNFNAKRVYGFCDGKANTSDDRCYEKVTIWFSVNNEVLDDGET